MYQAMLDKNIDLLKKILTPDFYLHHYTDTNQTAEEWFDDMTSGRVVYLSTQEYAIKDITTADDTASLTGQNIDDLTVNGERRSINLELKMTFVKINDEWFIKKGDASLFQI